MKPYEQSSFDPEVEAVNDQSFAWGRFGAALITLGGVILVIWASISTGYVMQTDMAREFMKSVVLPISTAQGVVGMVLIPNGLREWFDYDYYTPNKLLALAYYVGCYGFIIEFVARLVSY